MSLVVDATLVAVALTQADGFEALGEEDLVAPALMWSEARSATGEALWRADPASRR